MTVSNWILVILLLAPLPVFAADDNEKNASAYIVNDYRYDPAGSDGDADSGHTLCATRCNSLSFDYADYVMADPREVKRVATGRELIVPLDNPFLAGHCICTVDEFIITPNLRNRPK